MRFVYRLLLVSFLLGVPSLRADEARSEWIDLFDGTSLAEWHTYRGGGPAKWAIEDGLLTTTEKCGDLATNRLFGDFELHFEWKVAPGANSGVMFRVEDSPTESASKSGIEYQILDDELHRDGRNPLTSAGSLYALYAPTTRAAKPAGEWNSGRIVVKGASVRFWMNDVLVVEAMIGSEDWRQRIAASKHAKSPRYAAAARGAIVLQDHWTRVWYRNVRVREL